MTSGSNAFASATVASENWVDGVSIAARSGAVGFGGLDSAGDLWTGSRSARFDAIGFGSSGSGVGRPFGSPDGAAGFEITDFGAVVGSISEAISGSSSVFDSSDSTGVVTGADSAIFDASSGFPSGPPDFAAAGFDAVGFAGSIALGSTGLDGDAGVADAADFDPVAGFGAFDSAAGFDPLVATDAELDASAGAGFDSLGATGPDASAGAGPLDATDPGLDASAGGFDSLDDASFDPSDGVATAFDSPAIGSADSIGAGCGFGPFDSIGLSMGFDAIDLPSRSSTLSAYRGRAPVNGGTTGRVVPAGGV